MFGHAHYVLSEYLGDNPWLGKYQIIMHTGDWKGITSVSQINGGSFQFYKPNRIDYYLGTYTNGASSSFELKLVQTSDGTTDANGMVIPSADYDDHSEYINMYVRNNALTHVYSWSGVSMIIHNHFICVDYDSNDADFDEDEGCVGQPNGFTLEVPVYYMGSISGDD